MDYEKKIREYMVSSKVDQLYKSMLKNLFPELAESKDERIRKELINFCKIAATGQSSILIEDANQFNRWAAWLEKQGESYTKKDVDDAYLKGICDAKHELEKQGEQKQEETWPNLSNCLHDCKKCTGKCFYRKEKYQGEQKLADKIEPKFKVGQTIKKEGFNLGFTIVKIEDCFYYNDIGDYFPFTDQDNWELVEQKPAWSEEDEKMLQNAIFFIEVYRTEKADTAQAEATFNWLKSLRPKNTWKPSEEQIRVVARLRHCLLEDVRGNDVVILDNLLEQLKAL